MAQVGVTAQSSVDMSAQNLTDQKIAQLESDIMQLDLKAQYWQGKIQYSEKIVAMCDGVIGSKGFHPIEKTKARVAKLKETFRLSDAKSALRTIEAKKMKLEMRKANQEIKREKNARRMENKITKKANAGPLSVMQVDNGKVDFQKSWHKDLTQDLFDSKGNPTPNFDRLKQILVDYPQSITTLPDNVIQEMSQYRLQIKQTQQVPQPNGRTISVTKVQDRSAFEYICGMTAAGFQIAEQQGRTLQSNPVTKTEFLNWKAQKELELQNAKNKTKQQTNTNTNANQADAQF